MGHGRVIMRLAAMAVVALVGAGACAFDPPSDAGPRPLAAGGAGGETGASASPGPDQNDAPGPTATPTAASTPKATPSPSASRSASTTTASAKDACPQGEKQRQVETYLALLGGFGQVVVDGRQSPGDCAAIKKFQRRYGILPAAGRAGVTTADVARRLASTDTGKCKDGKGTTFCVDLTLQTVWVMRDGEVVMPPTVTRSGMAGFATATGVYAINGRNLSEWSRPYKVWLPYWQHFTRGMGFHETTTYIHDKSLGSHGCVNVLPRDARTLWELGKIGTRVHVFGHRPGT